MKVAVEAILRRQAEWQKSRAALPWAEKLRRSVALRKAMLELGRGAIRPKMPADRERPTPR